MSLPALITTEGALVNPVTGELVAPDDPPAVARLANDLSRLTSMIRDARSYATGLLVEASREAGTKTLRFGNLKVEVRDTAQDVTWDLEVLGGLLDAGLPQQRYDELVKAVVSYSVDGRVARSISAANPLYAEIIGRARTLVPKPAYVRITEE